MKIASITNVIYPFTVGGSEIRNYEVLKRLAKKGHDVHIYGAKLWQGKDELFIDGIKVHGISRYDNLIGNFKKATFLDPYILSLKIFRVLLKEKFDIIDNLTFVFSNCYAAKYASLIKRIPLVFTWQQHFGDYFLGFMDKEAGLKKKNIEKKTIKFSDFNIAVSNAVKKNLIKEGMRTEDIEVIYNGADLRAIKNTPSYKKEFDLIFVGRLTYQKRPELLIDSLKLLKREFPKIKLCIVGNGNKKEKMMQDAKKFNLDKNITFVGEIKDRKKIYQYMKSAKIFVLPSLFEGFPLVCVEASACGLPLVMADEKWNRTEEFISGNGILAEPTPKRFVSAISQLLKNHKERDRMEKCGIEIVEQFDWDNIADETLAYYGQVIRKYDEQK